MTIQQNDAAGGSGSIADALLGIAVNGISRGVDGYLAKKLPLTSSNELVTYDAFGNALPKGAPQVQQSFGSIVKSPVGIAVGALILGGVLVVVLVKAVK